GDVDVPRPRQTLRLPGRAGAARPDLHVQAPPPLTPHPAEPPVAATLVERRTRPGIAPPETLAVQAGVSAVPFPWRCAGRRVRRADAGPSGSGGSPRTPERRP